MKRLIVISLAVFLLAGCAGQKRAETTAPATAAPATSAAQYYTPDSLVQTQTNGAVLAYALPDGDCGRVLPMGDRLLLVSTDGWIRALEGTEGRLTATVQTGADLLQDTAFSISDSRVSFFREETWQVVLLDARLVEYAWIDLPEDISGHPVVSLTANVVYYCREGEVRAIALDSGISRLVFAHSYPRAELIGCHLDGKILILETLDADGSTGVLYLDSATGQIRGESRQVLPFSSEGDAYLTENVDGQIRQHLFGLDGGEPAVLNVDTPVYDALRQRGAVACSTDEGCVVLDFYDLSSGLRTAGVTIPDVSEVVDIHCDGQYIWVLGHKTLYRWNPILTPLADETVYVCPYYTAENPDREGLNTCEERAQTLENRYGIRVRLWEDAVDGLELYDLVPEHQVPVLNRMLDALEISLAQFPDGLLGKTIRGGKLQICLVRSIGQEETYLQFYSGGDAYIVLSADAQMNLEFIQALSYIVDSHVLGNSRDYDDWAELNPPDFAYALAEDWVPDETASAYLTDENRYFINERAMRFPVEDRCSIFQYAMRPDGASMFAGAAMQAKLCRLCEGIREAYGLEKVNQSLPWEQYLTLKMDFQN